MIDCNFILSSFPSTEEKQKDLLEIISSIKSIGWDVTLMTHFDCPDSIKNKVDLYLYNDTNTSAFKDSNILNPEIVPLVENIPSYKWVGTEGPSGSTLYYDYKGWIDFTPAIVSLFIPSLGASFAKGYDFCVYMETDFIFPKDFGKKINSFLEELLRKDLDSIFFLVPRSHWVYSYLFILRMNSRVRSLIPNLNIRKNSDFISKYPNMVFEDFITSIANTGRENSIFKSNDELDHFFGGPIGENWDIDKLSYNKNEYTLYTTSVCSPYVNKDNISDIRILLHLSPESPFSLVRIKFKLLCGSELMMEESNTLSHDGWVWYKIPDAIWRVGKIRFLFSIESLDGDGMLSHDEYDIDTSRFLEFSKLRYFVESK